MDKGETGRDTLETLERQLVAERHYSAMLQAMLPDIAETTARRVTDLLLKRACRLAKRLLLASAMGVVAAVTVGVLIYLLLK